MPEKLLHYDVLERLGEGARSTIYAVRDPETRQVYALKHVIRDETKDIRFIEQMETEFEISKQFTHQNLRRTYDLKIVKTLLLKVSEAFMIMELFEGKALDVRPTTGMLNIVDDFIQVANALKAMHQMGYAHCDLKPNNILRNEKGEIKVIDFGQSCKIGTIKERIQGTPDYIAPEQVAKRPIVVQTDIYNFGATLYWALTGRNIPTLYTTNKKGENSFLLDVAITTPQELNANVPAALSNLVMDCVATKIQKRPAEMDVVLNRLDLARHVLYRQTHPATEPMMPDLSDSTHPGVPNP